VRFTSLGSGSAGNATLVAARGHSLLVDCGFSMRETVKRMQRAGFEPEALSAIFVTHEHGDHIKGVGPFARRYGTPVYMTRGTWEKGRTGAIPNLRLFDFNRPIEVGPFLVRPITVPHDAREPCQFVIECQQRRLGMLTDLGSITHQVRDAYQDCDALFLECNHDLDMLARGPYPYALKQRVGGHYGHLNNTQSARLLEEVDQTRLQQLVVAHISEKNNTWELARQALDEVIAASLVPQQATQEQGLDWLEII